MRVLIALLIGASFTFAAKPVFEKQTLFEAGQGGYAVYRIPGIVVTDRGSLIAYCEARKSGASDWGAIDLVYRRSANGGKTWSEPTKFDVGGGFEKNPVAVNKKLGGFPDITINNPVMIADKGIVHFLYCVEYFRCFYTRSEDDGKTFAPPIEITRTFEDFRKDYDWKVLATGPGHGLRLSKSGRLIVPVWLSTGEGGHAHRPSAVSVIFSDDTGKTWQRGDIVVKHSELINPSETAIVELRDGRVMLNIRHESTPHHRAVSISENGATKWSKPKLDPNLPDPICMGSLVGMGERILFSNAFNPDGRERKNLSVQLSEDDGTTWTSRRSIESGLSAYSDLAVDAKGTIYCLYERGGYKSLQLATFNFEWLQLKPIRVACLGDSITKGHRNNVADSETFPAQLEAALRKDGFEVEVLNAGVTGETSMLGLKRLPAIVAGKPDFVAIMYGINDLRPGTGKKGDAVSIEQYRTNLTSMIAELRKAGIAPILMTQHLREPFTQNMLKKYMEACREMAASEKVLLIDHRGPWKGDAVAIQPMGRQVDLIHPDREGFAEMVEVAKPIIAAAIRERVKK